MAAGDLRAETYAAILLGRARSLRNLNVLISQVPEQVLEAREPPTRRALVGTWQVLCTDCRCSSRTTSTARRCLPRLERQASSATARAPTRTSSMPCFAPAAFSSARPTCARAGVRHHQQQWRIRAGAQSVRPVQDPGGSSGGNAAGVAARFAPAGIGSDTGGSTRIPAALCGVVGFRPTIGRLRGRGPLAGVREVVPIAHTRDTPGPIARSVADVALLDAVITGQPRTLPRADLRELRLGVARRSFFADLDPALEEVVDEALRPASG